MSRFARRFVDVRKMLRDLRVSVETVDNVKIFREFGRLFGHIRSASSADYQNVQFALVLCDIFSAKYRNVRSEYFNCFGIAPREYGAQLHIRVLLYRAFDAPSEISVTCNTDPDHNKYLFS